MNKSMKYLLIFFFSLYAFSASSQIFRIKGGVNLNSVLYETEKGKLNNVYDMSNPGFHIGATMNNPLSGLLSFESGLFVSLKGFKVDADNSSDYNAANISNLFYLDVPIAIKASFDMGASSLWYLASGPNFGIGMAGNYVTVYNYSGSKQREKEKIKWGNDEGEYNRFDLAWTFGGGIEFNDWQVALNYDHGLSNIASDADSNLTIKNRVLKLSVGYTLGN